MIERIGNIREQKENYPYEVPTTSNMFAYHEMTINLDTIGVLSLRWGQDELALSVRHAADTNSFLIQLVA